MDATKLILFQVLINKKNREVLINKKNREVFRNFLLIKKIEKFLLIKIVLIELFQKFFSYKLHVLNF